MLSQRRFAVIYFSCFSDFQVLCVPVIFVEQHGLFQLKMVEPTGSQQVHIGYLGISASASVGFGYFFFFIFTE